MDLLNLTQSGTVIVLLVVARMGALVWTLPFLSAGHLSVPIRVGLTLVVSWMLVPFALSTEHPTFAGNETWGPPETAACVLAVVHEILIGATMGLAVRVLLGAAQITASVLESLSGLSFGATMNPGGEAGNSPLRQLFWWTTASFFVASGGASRMVAGILKSYQVWPVGTLGYDRTLLDFLITALSNGFEFALRAALPGFAALMVAAAVLGIVQRNCPQLGGMQVGLGIKAIAGLLVTSLLLVSAPWVIAGGLDETWAHWYELVTRAGQGGALHVR